MAESANTGRSNSFVLEELTEFQREKLKMGSQLSLIFLKMLRKKIRLSKEGTPKS